VAGAEDYSPLSVRTKLNKNRQFFVDPNKTTRDDKCVFRDKRCHLKN
jgi:hypothetical protein